MTPRSQKRRETQDNFACTLVNTATPVVECTCIMDTLEELSFSTDIEFLPLPKIKFAPFSSALIYKSFHNPLCAVQYLCPKTAILNICTEGELV